MNEQEQQMLQALSGEQRLTIARAARVFAQDLGFSQSAAVLYCLDNPPEVARLGAAITDLATALRPPVAAPDVSDAASDASPAQSRKKVKPAPAAPPE